MRGSVLQLTKFFWVAFTLLVVMNLAANQQEWVPQRLIDAVRVQYGKSSSKSLERWREFMEENSQTRDEEELLEEVNDFFNREVPYVSDQKHWNKRDYWATPVESLITNGGDCEDYAIAKYYTLLRLGISAEKLRITYVMALKFDIAHMVLAYYPKPDSIPLILDNLSGWISPADKRKDLKPVYSFNTDGLWLERAKNKVNRRGNSNELDLWMDVKIRMTRMGLPL